MKPSELLARPESWTQHVNATDDRGLHVESTSPRAACWCALGAIHKCAKDKADGASITDDDATMLANRWTEKATEALWNHRWASSLHSWNDRPERTHAEVLALLKEVGL
jgi:hypothetical protein